MGHHKQYKYTVADVAALALTTEGNIRQMIRRKQLDMESLVSVLGFVARRNPLALK